jgi:NADH-quinone oxidoreductase subunit M
LGGYGMIRFVLMPMPLLTHANIGIVLSICCVGYTLATLTSIRQLDLKRFIAYTSISHMNFGIAVLFTVKEPGFLSFVHTMVSHGIVASGLFLLVGHVYKQTSARDSMHLKGLAGLIPYFAISWFIFSMANLGMPLLSGFPGEFYGMVSVAMTNRALLGAFFLGFYFSGVYSFLNVGRLLHGTIRTNLVNNLSDLSISTTIAVVVLIL